MKAYPRQIFVAKKPRRKKFLAEIQWVDTMLFEKLKIDTRLNEQSFRLRIDLVQVDVEVEVELPAANGLRHASFAIRESNSELNQF